MKSTRKVSVIIVNYNGIDHVDACISSVSRQTYPDFEIIFVDNDSTDGSLSYAEARFPNLIFLANKRNLAYGGGICSALASASGKYIAPLNIDTEVAADWLYEQVHFLDENPAVGAVTPKLLLFDNRNRINALGMNIHVSGLGFCRELYRKDRSLTEAHMVCGFSGSSFLIRREILERINEVVDQWPILYDDVVLSWITQLMGYDIWCVPKAVVYHKYRLKINPNKFYLLELERYSLLLSTLKPTTFLIYFPVFAIIELLTISFSMLKGKEYVKSKVRALAGVFRRFPDIRRKRRGYQELRKISDFRLFKNLSWNLAWTQLLSILN